MLKGERTNGLKWEIIISLNICRGFKLQIHVRTCSGIFMLLPYAQQNMHFYVVWDFFYNLDR